MVADVISYGFHVHEPASVADSNAAAAFRISCLPLGSGSANTAWESPISFRASASCALYSGTSINIDRGLRPE